jgi:hypothetical protein
VSGRITNTRIKHRIGETHVADDGAHTGYGRTAEEAQNALEEAQRENLRECYQGVLLVWGSKIESEDSPDESSDESSSDETDETSSSEDEEERLYRLAERKVEARWQAGEFDIDEEDASGDDESCDSIEEDAADDGAEEEIEHPIESRRDYERRQNLRSQLISALRDNDKPDIARLDRELREFEKEDR